MLFKSLGKTVHGRVELIDQVMVVVIFKQISFSCVYIIDSQSCQLDQFSLC